MGVDGMGVDEVDGYEVEGVAHRVDIGVEKQRRA